MISGKTRLLGLMGHPVRHSLSPGMHNASFETEGLDYVYVAMDVRPEDLPRAVGGAVALGFRGFNLTMPHKERIIPLLDGVDEAAAVSEAVNTVVIGSSGLRGYNTDGSGLMEACGEVGVEISGRRIAIVGAGGAAASIAFALQEEGAGGLLVFNRDTERAGRLLGRLRKAGAGIEGRAYPYEALDEMVPEADVIVNVIPLGMRPEDPLPLPVERLRKDAVVCDAVYRPEGPTRLVETARDRGLRVVAGQRMLLYQGVQAQRLWTGLEPNVEAMNQALS